MTCGEYQLRQWMNSLGYQAVGVGGIRNSRERIWANMARPLWRLRLPARSKSSSSQSSGILQYHEIGDWILAGRLLESTCRLGPCAGVVFRVFRGWDWKPEIRRCRSENSWKFAGSGAGYAPGGHTASLPARPSPRHGSLSASDCPLLRCPPGRLAELARTWARKRRWTPLP